MVGYDSSNPMIKEAKRCHPSGNFIESSDIKNKFDYIISSGIYNVKQECDDHEWLNYVKQDLAHINKMSTMGFAFNCLTNYSDKEKMKEHLYYADPGSMFNYCKKNFSRNVALLHDYNLYEFTVLVTKDA